MNIVENTATYLQKSILEGLDDAIVAIDNSFKVLYFNEKAERLLDVKRDDVLGQCVYKLWPDAPEKVRYVEKTVQYQTEMTIKDVPYRWGKYNIFLNISTKILKDENGIPFGAMAQFSEVTEQVELKNDMSNRIEEMGVTIIPLSEKIALLPLYSNGKDLHEFFIVERSLGQVSALKPNVLIIDMSTIVEASNQFIDMLSKLIQAVGLLGIKTAISGIRPKVAQTWVRVPSKELKQTPHFMNLSAALANFMKK